MRRSVVMMSDQNVHYWGAVCEAIFGQNSNHGKLLIKPPLHLWGDWGPLYLVNISIVVSLETIISGQNLHHGQLGHHYIWSKSPSWSACGSLYLVKISTMVSLGTIISGQNLHHGQLGDHYIWSKSPPWAA